MEGIKGVSKLKSFIKIFVVFAIIISLCVPVLAVTKKKSKKVKEIEPQRIEYQSKDNFTIAADLWLPGKLEKNTKIPLIIMLHSIGESRKSWAPYAKELAGMGYSVLTIDLRGHGESILRNKKKLYWRSFAAENWTGMIYDVTDGINYLKQNNPEVNIDKILIIGSSLGANVAVKTAEKEKTRVKALALLSPFGNYKGIEARVPLVNYGPHPLLIIVSKTDKISYEASNELIKYSQGSHEVLMVKNAGHGIYMLKFEPKLKKMLFDWLVKVLPPTAIALPGTGKKSKKPKQPKE